MAPDRVIPGKAGLVVYWHEMMFFQLVGEGMDPPTIAGMTFVMRGAFFVTEGNSQVAVVTGTGKPARILGRNDKNCQLRPNFGLWAANPDWILGKRLARPQARLSQIDFGSVHRSSF